MSFASAGWSMETWGQQFTRIIRNHEEQNSQCAPGVVMLTQLTLEGVQKLAGLPDVPAPLVMDTVSPWCFWPPSYLNPQISPRSALSTPTSSFSTRMNFVLSPWKGWSRQGGLCHSLPSFLLLLKQVISICSSCTACHVYFQGTCLHSINLIFFKVKPLPFKTTLSSLDFKNLFWQYILKSRTSNCFFLFAFLH